MKVVIIGGIAAGMSAAAKLKRMSPNDEVIVYEKGDIVSFGACGLPYYAGGFFEDPNEMIARTPEEFRASGIKLFTNHEVMKVDFGGIAKGYTSASVMEIFKECGVASGLVSLGGNVQALGSKVDGCSWKVAVQNPDSEENYLGVLSIKDKAVITSGGYERYFEKNGKVYHHIIDPSTGYPANSGLKSVTIVSNDGTLADGLSTSLFIMGLKKATDYWRENSDKFDAIFLTSDNKQYATEGIYDNYSSDYTVEKIKK